MKREGGVTSERGCYEQGKKIWANWTISCRVQSGIKGEKERGRSESMKFEAKSMRALGQSYLDRESRDREGSLFSRRKGGGEVVEEALEGKRLLRRRKKRNPLGNNGNANRLSS